MSKKIVAIVGLVLVVSLVGLFIVGSVFAEAPATPTPPPQAPLARAWGRVQCGAGIVAEAVADLLDMTPTQILNARIEGKTLAEIAKEQGVSEQQLIDAIVAAEQKQIEWALKDGTITQEQADWLIAKAKAMAPFQLSNPFAPGQGGRGGMMGGKMMRGGKMNRGNFGQQQQTTPQTTPAPQSSSL